MKTRWMMLATTAALSASLYCLPALAQPGPGPMMGQQENMMQGKGASPGPGAQGGPQQGMRAPRDCSKAPNPQRCETRMKAREACKEKAGPERKRCMHEHLPPKPGPASQTGKP